MTNWVVASGDNGGLPCIVIDKTAADVFVFDAQSHFVGTTPALLGSAPGDESDPGVGDRELSAIAPDKRTTPAASWRACPPKATRYCGSILNGVSMHPVVTTNKRTPPATAEATTSEDNRTVRLHQRRPF
jgi:hypothetical protein